MNWLPLTSALQLPTIARRIFSIMGSLVIGSSLVPASNSSVGNALVSPAPTVSTNITQTVRIAPAVSSGPAPTTTPSKPLTVPAELYRVRVGDTLWAIGHRRGLSAGTIARADRMTSTTLSIGQYLAVPARYVPVQATTVAMVAKKFHVAPGLVLRLNPRFQDGIPAAATVAIPFSTHLSWVAMPGHPTLSSPDLQRLAHLVQAEAGNQPFTGQVAVAAVVLNRLKAPGFPKTLAQVIAEPGQFQSVANGSIRQAPSGLAVLAAAAAARGWDPSRGALYFYNPTLTHESWIRHRPVLVAVGQQRFCH